jgi:hypothetical protein
MNIVSKLYLAGLAIAIIATGSLASSVKFNAGDLAAAINADSGATMIALNPRPLPPDRYDDFDFRG